MLILTFKNFYSWMINYMFWNLERAVQFVVHAVGHFSSPDPKAEKVSSYYSKTVVSVVLRCHRPLSSTLLKKYISKISKPI